MGNLMNSRTGSRSNSVLRDIVSASFRLLTFEVICLTLLLLPTVKSAYARLIQSDLTKQDEFQLLLVEQERFLHFVRGHDGGVSARQETTGLVSPLEFFTHPAIVESLGLSSEEVDAITSHFESATDKQKELHNSKNDVEALRESTRESCLEFFAKAMSELTSAQKNRLKQIQFQFLLYRGGYLRFLNEPTIREALRLPNVTITDEFETELIERQEQVAKSLIEKERLLVSEALDIWLESLDERQRKIFDRDWGEILRKPGALGVLANYLVSDFEMDSDEIQSKELQLFWDAPVLQHSANGNFDSLALEDKQLRNDNDGRINKLTDSHSSLKKLYSLQHLFRSGFVGELIVLVPEQALKVVAINDQFERQKTTTVMGVAGKFNIAVKKIIQVKSKAGIPREQPIYDWPEDMSPIEAETEKRMESVAAKTFDDLLNVLLPHQIEDLKLAVGRLQIRAHGPLTDIRFGELRRELELSESDVESLEKAAAKAHKFLGEKSLEARDEAIQAIDQSLPDTLRREIRFKLGEPVTSGHCDLRNFALALLTFEK